MTLRHYHFAALVPVLCAVLACAGSRPPVPAEVATGRTCGPDRVASQDTAWREVSGDGFTYCVPVTWRAVDSRAQQWRGPSLEFAWGEGLPASARRLPFAVTRMGAGQRVEMRPSHAEGARGLVVYLENIGGKSVRLILDHPSGRLERGALVRTEPDLTLYGTAKSEEAATTIRAVHRSIRFSEAP